MGSALSNQAPFVTEWNNGNGERGSMPAFHSAATARDIFYCFRLLLGRYPNREEWRGHASRVGDSLQGVVASFTGSLECSRRGLFRARPDSPAHVLTEFNGFRIYSAADDALVGQGIRSGAYEPEVCTHVRRLLRPSMALLDLGANIGFFALLGASLVGPQGLVVAVEPNPANARLLEASRRANGFSQLRVLQVAAGSDIALLVLNASYSNGTTAPLPDSDRDVLNATTVPAFPLDMLLPNGRRFDLIKVDVEGAEYRALLGCEAMIRRDRPNILSEFSPGLMPGISGIDGPGYLRWLIGLGYAVSVIQPDATVLPCGTDESAVMRAYRSRGTDHIDLLLEPRS